MNKSLAPAGIPPEALEWVIDQYQVSTTNAAASPATRTAKMTQSTIVRLVGQVIRVSVETVQIVAGLPQNFT